MTSITQTERQIQEALITALPDLLDEEKKAVSLRKLEGALDGLDEDLVEGIDEVREAIENYREAGRADKEDAWADIASALEDVALVEQEESDEEEEADEERPPPAAPPAPPPPAAPSGPGGRDPDQGVSIGQWFRGQFLRAGANGASPADLYKILRRTAQETQIDYRGGTYGSFFRELWWLKQVRYIERTGRTAPSYQRGRRPGDRKGGQRGFPGVLKAQKVFYRLTKKGRESDPATWENLTALVHKDRLEAYWWRQYQPLTGRPRGRPAREVVEEPGAGATRRRRTTRGEPPTPTPAPPFTEGRRRVKLAPEQEVRNQLISLRDGIRGLAVQWSAQGVADLLAKTQAAGRLLANRLDPLETLEDESKAMTATQRASLEALRALVETYDAALEQMQTFSRRWGVVGPSTAAERASYDAALGRIVRSLPSPA